MPKDGPDYSHLPIPTYDEAISSRATSSTSFNTPAGAGTSSEREGLITSSSTSRQAPSSTNRGYHPPTAESVRSSIDSDITSLRSSHDTDREENELRQDLEEMEVDDSGSSRLTAAQQRALFFRRKIMARISGSISRFHLPRIPVSLSNAYQHLPSYPERLKPSFPVLARIIVVTLIIAGVYALMMSRMFDPRAIGAGSNYIPESIRTYAQENIDKARIDQNLRQISYDDHIAGTSGDIWLAGLIKQKMEDCGLDVLHTENFFVTMNYPRPGEQRVAITAPEDQRWEASLQEDRVDPDLNQHQAPAFHALSASGNVTGRLVYANYGARADFQWLDSQGISVKDAIVLVRYYGYAPDPASKIHAAAQAGAAGVLLYSDPADDGFHKGPTWPDGPWRTSDSMHRASAARMSNIIGDVATPGRASTHDAPRLTDTSESPNPALPQIPSLPLSWRDAKPLLSALRSHGIAVPRNWLGGVPDVGDTWFTGNASSSPMVNLVNNQDHPVKQTVRNLIGMIHGREEPEAHIYIGSHRDAFCFGSVPGMGTAIMLELARVFGELLSLGWRPRRTLVFANWDASEVNLVGSTEHVEGEIDVLRRRAFAYLNVGQGVTGPHFQASGSPVFSRALMRALDRVTDPVSNVTLRQKWDGLESRLQPPLASDDGVPFQALGGCSSIDLRFSAVDEMAYPKGSCYATYRWMKEMGDPGLAYSHALAQVWALLALDLADEPLLNFDMVNYASEVHRYVRDLQDEAAAFSRAAAADERARSGDRTARAVPPSVRDSDPDDDADDGGGGRGGKGEEGRQGRPPTDDQQQQQQQQQIKQLLNVSSLAHAAGSLRTAAHQFNQWGVRWQESLTLSSSSSGSASTGETNEQAINRMSHNARMSEFETHLLDLPGEHFGSRFDGQRAKGSGGLPGRQQYKHVVYGVGRWEGREGGRMQVWPFVRDAIERTQEEKSRDGGAAAVDWDEVQRWVEITAERLEFAAGMLVK